MNRTMTSPRRPIILKRKKQPFQRNEADETQNKSSTASGAESVSASAQDSIRVVDHPTRPEALVVVVPETASLQSLLDALDAKRKERGTPGPNKFIFVFGRCGSDDEVKALFQATSENKNLLRPEAGAAGNDQTLPNSELPVTSASDSDKEKFDGCVQLQEPAVDPSASSFPQAMQVCYQQQQKRVVADPKKATVCTTERKMSPQQTSTASNPISRSGCKRLCIAPKVSNGESSVVVMSAPVAEVQEERVCIPFSEPCNSEEKEMLRKRYKRISRRKQRLVPLSHEEPVLLFPDSTFFDSGLVSDVSAFQEMECDLEPGHDLQLQSETFKTPDKGSHPASSTPSKSLEPWEITPLDQRNCSILDFSPIRTPPQRHEHSELSFCSTPFRDLPLFGSPRELLASCSHEQQTESSNHSLTEDFVLDTMNDSLSNILVDISFSGLEDDDLGMANLSWSQFIPELKLDASL
ncbi:forkhead box protein M1-like isoform X4 [Tachysurus fulvidraco]|uniref:forkhead box protein M1-like isoform X4 n=1 Tax=Tachysurus fulvidraco TaxID=1234273 RepID=UPI001FEF2F14|nr:forkhead box protein M1-like isoform X4 [Tachysurus fulvidraco]